MHRNASEMSRHATEYLTGRHGFSQDIGDEFEKELVRYLHNYLTSVYSLIEAQRVVMRHCWGKGSEFELGEYTERRKASFETGEAEFMTELRNYCTHRSIPLPGISTTFSGGIGRPNLLINRLTLDRDKLLDWNGWTAPAKAYLRAKDEQFDLGPVIESYVNTASAFFNWFVQRINELNEDIKNEYQTAAMEYVKWYEEAMGMNTEGYRRLFGPPPSRTGTGNRAERRGQRQQPKRVPKRNRKGKGR
ncbi:hypothetical protein HZU40_22380 [Mycolicibacterium fluoranthenivorans]|uniref:Uncharacterized protein n=2 Tax=Mycolicibacterium fluoranthenivorans TaxID=258505 RepID=A0A7G8PPK8_9MYCO|nr:hypothetical protein HZU40_22380 [Mycolicibacterium fluoranthenivorans]